MGLSQRGLFSCEGFLSSMRKVGARLTLEKVKIHKRSEGLVEDTPKIEYVETGTQDVCRSIRVPKPSLDVFDMSIERMRI